MIKFQQGLDPDPDPIYTLLLPSKHKHKHAHVIRIRIITRNAFLITIMAMDGVTFEFDSRSAIQSSPHIHPIIVDVKSCLILGHIL